jgi:nucleotide-binding universal stress UspA family protein
MSIKTQPNRNFSCFLRKRVKLKERGINIKKNNHTKEETEMKLLVPVDGSLASFNAVKKSVEIAKQYHFSIKMITVVESANLSRHNRNERLWRQVDGSIIAGTTRTRRDEELNSELWEYAQNLLESITKELDFEGIEVEKEVLEGEAYQTILDEAEKGSFDLLVMGNRGFSKIKRFFVGSVTQRVISEAKCPVLVIHTDSGE